MHKTFTGSSRRTRQVNLSGRPTNTNPFGSRTGQQSITQKLLDERAERQYQHALDSGTRRAQRMWRGRECRVEARRQIREEYLGQERQNLPLPSRQNDAVVFQTKDDAILQLQRLLFFSDTQNSFDQIILYRFCLKIEATVRQTPNEWHPTKSISKLLVGLQNRVVAAIHYECVRRPPRSIQQALSSYQRTSKLLEALLAISSTCPAHTASNGDRYFQAVADILRFLKPLRLDPESELAPFFLYNADLEKKVASLIAFPLVHNHESDAIIAYQWLTRRLFVIPELIDGIEDDTARDNAQQPPSHLIDIPSLLAELSKLIVPSRLTVAIKALVMDETEQQSVGLADLDASRRVLALFIYFKSSYGRTDLRTADRPLGNYSTDRDFLLVVSRLLSATIRNEQEQTFVGEEKQNTTSSSPSSFRSRQIHKLVDESCLRDLISSAQIPSDTAHPPSVSDAFLYANHALALLRSFPEEADQMRMWLFLGSSKSLAGPTPKQSAIRYFWQATRQTQTFAHIKGDSQALSYIVLDTRFYKPSHEVPKSAENDWRLIFMFLELYTFIMKVMNDDEFFASDEKMITNGTERVSQTKASALPLDEIKDLVTFLKHLGLSLYLDVASLESQTHEGSEPRSIADLFKVPHAGAKLRINEPQLTCGPTGVSLSYVRTLVTGLLRMIYERDSRRPFLPEGHWLMNSRLSALFSTDELFRLLIKNDMDGYEEEDDDTEMQDAPDDDNDENDDEPRRIIGTRRAERLAQQEMLRREQGKAHDQRQSFFLKPRFSVMENMPYTIPFLKRAQLFREFVKTDKVLRRYGRDDADYWRAVVISRPHGRSTLERQMGTIRRDHELEDAFDEFYEIGDRLKEPIQIRFMDSFGTVEAGVDGGGVTKEFLTSVGTQIKKNEYLPFFAENDENLLFPNPTLIEDLKETYGEGNDAVVKALQFFEFIGRVVGKCLYEEILVDLNFAPFFLKKWSVADIDGAPGFRATLDDLRSYDQGLYHGLLALKNHPGDVEADFDVDFTIVDTATNAHTGKTRSITRPLHPLGSNMKVTSQNRLLYVFRTALHRLVVQPRPQTNAFLTGLSSMIKPAWLRMFNGREIQTLLAGTSAPVDLADLRRHVTYSGTYQIGNDGLEHPTIQYFWKAMESLPEEDKRAVLKFVTSAPRAPLLGFEKLNPPFTIRDSGSDEKRLPTASTCVNLLKLPMFKSVEVLREKLLYAVSAGAGFDLS